MVSQVNALTNGQETLTARPPTPPRGKRKEQKGQKEQKKQDQQQTIETIEPSSAVLPRQTRSRRSLLIQAEVHTPPGRSPDSCDSENTSSRRTAKKVGFSTQPDEYREPPTYNSNKENVPKPSTPVTAPSSAGSNKLIKSILKPSPAPNPLNPFAADIDDPNKQVNITAMLESTIKQLAGADRESKIDAYNILMRALRASNNLPDRIALQDQMGLFTQFIQRDITTKIDGGAIDSSLANHALTLLSTFLYFPAIASTLSHDFSVFIIDHCIRCFEDRLMPKDVVRHLMQVVATQDFSPKVMTADRVSRLVVALHKIEEHMKGKSIIMSRIIIYRKLIKQSRLHMVSRSDWLLDLFTDMLSSMKEIRAAAIALGFETVFTIGKEKQLSRKVMELLQMSVDETRYIEYYVQRLLAMVASNKQDSVVVPQIWSIVILLLRCPVDRWEFFSPWLGIIQKCFNSSDHQTKMEANYAWNRLVYAFYLNESSFSKTIVTICQPFITQLQRKVVARYLEDFRRVVIGSICNLYYYAFKPNSTSAQTDHFWVACVRPLMERLISLEKDTEQSGKTTVGGPENLPQAATILTGLFDSATPRLWHDDHIAETALVKPEELPALDPKWIRKNADKVFTVIDPIINKAFLDITRPETPVYKLWRTLISAVAAAAAKEVKVSSDTANFIAHTFGLLLKLWSAGPQQTSGDDPHVFVRATQEFLSIMIEHLGLLPFTETRLSMSKQNTFLPVATPSHRPGKGQGITRTPLHHLFAILSTKSPGVLDDDTLANLFRSTFSPFLAARAPRARIDLAIELMQYSSSTEAPSPYGPWLFISEIVSSSMENSQATHSSDGSGSGPTLGHEYREIVRHLERGIISTPNLPWEHWLPLFQLLVARVTDETGDAGCAVVVVEPLSKVFSDMLMTGEHGSISPNVWKGGVELLSTAKQPRDRQALDAARRRLWGTPAAGARSASFDPFDNLYPLINQLLETSYNHPDVHEELAPSILMEVAAFLTRCSRPLVLRSLTLLQSGISFWIQDTNEQYSGTQPSKMSDAVKNLWDLVCNLFTDSAALKDFQLDSIEPLLCAAFESKHRHIVNTVSLVWNQVFSQANNIEYPERLKTILLSIQQHVDIILPGLDVSSIESEGCRPAFLDSQDEFPISSSFLAGFENTPQLERPSSSARSTPTGSVKLSLPGKRSVKKTPKSSKRGSTPRLRHDDSQVHFAAIESSPLANAAESQVLTDRQREIRERQRETATLFPEIRSSPEKSKSVHRLSETAAQEVGPGGLPQVQASTPEAKHRHEEYVSSTPTPRRGQASLLDDDHEMTDEVPSSPPDPRRNLLPEMQPRSRSGSIPADFPLSSSPTSGSPTSKRYNLSRGHASQGPVMTSDTYDGFSVDQTEITNDITELEPAHTTNTSRELDESEAYLKDAQHQNHNVNGPQAERPETISTDPSLEEAQETPKSGGSKVLVHTPTGSATRASRKLRSASKKTSGKTKKHARASDHDHSFELSDGEERSMTRLVVELDSRKCEPMPHYDAQSPQKPSSQQKTQPSDCITVEGDSTPSQSKSRRTRSSGPVSPIAQPDGDATPSSNKKSKKKRKRPSEKDEQPSGKKRRHRSAEVTDNESVLDSQMAAPAEQVSSEPDAGNDESMVDMETTAENVLPPASSQIVSEEVKAAEGASPRSTSSLDGDREADAVNLQLWTEASQEAESMRNNWQLDEEALTNLEEDVEDTEMEEAPTELEIMVPQAVATAEENPREEIIPSSAPAPVPAPAQELSAMEKIMGALSGGLDELRTAALSRDEVYRIEDMFMDIKRELYNAENRGRRT